MDSKRRSRIQPRFVLEQLDKRLVLSSGVSPIHVHFDHIVLVQHFLHREHSLHVTPPVHGGRGTHSKPADPAPGTVQLPLSIDSSQQGVLSQPVTTMPSTTTAPASIQLTFTNDNQATLNPFANSTPPTISQQTSTVAVTSTTAVSPTSYPNLSRLGQSLEQLFVAFEQGGITSADAVAQRANLALQGDSVSVNVGTNGNYSQLISELDGLGMQTQTSLPYIEDVSGLIPISQLGNLSELTDATSINPVTGTPGQSQGSSTGFTLH